MIYLFSIHWISIKYKLNEGDVQLENKGSSWLVKDIQIVTWPMTKNINMLHYQLLILKIYFQELHIIYSPLTLIMEKYIKVRCFWLISHMSDISLSVHNSWWDCQQSSIFYILDNYSSLTVIVLWHCLRSNDRKSSVS